MVRSSPQKSYSSSGGHASLHRSVFVVVKRKLFWDTYQLSNGCHHVEGSGYVRCHPHILNMDAATSLQTLGVITQKIVVITVRQIPFTYTEAAILLQLSTLCDFTTGKQGFGACAVAVAKVYMLEDRRRSRSLTVSFTEAGKRSPIFRWVTY